MEFREATAEEKKAAIAAVEKLTAAFQSGSCQTIYDQASEAFRKLEPQRDWERVCGELNGQVTAWRVGDQSFEVAENIVYVDLQAALSDGRSIRFAFQIDQSGAAKLFHFAFGQGNQWVNIPERPGTHFQDPPLERPKRYGV